MAIENHNAPQGYSDFVSDLLLAGHRAGSMLTAAEALLERVVNKPYEPALPKRVNEDLMAVIHLLWEAQTKVDDVVLQLDQSTLDFNLESVQATARVEA